MPSPVKRAALIGAANRARQRLPPIESLENLVSLGKERRHLDCERITSGQGVLALSIMAGEEWPSRIHLIDKRSSSPGANSCLGTEGNKNLCHISGCAVGETEMLHSW